MNFASLYFVFALLVATFRSTQTAKKTNKIPRFTEQDVVDGMKKCIREERVAMSPSRMIVIHQLNTETQPQLDPDFQKCFKLNFKKSIHPTEHFVEFCNVFDKALECFADDTSTIFEMGNTESTKEITGNAVADGVVKCFETGKSLVTTRQKEAFLQLGKNDTVRTTFQSCLLKYVTVASTTSADDDKYCRLVDKTMDCLTGENPQRTNDAKPEKKGTNNSYQETFVRCFETRTIPLTPERREVYGKLSENKTLVSKFERCEELHIDLRKTPTSKFVKFCDAVNNMTNCLLGNETLEKDKAPAKDASSSSAILKNLKDGLARCFSEKRIQRTPAIDAFLKKVINEDEGKEIFRTCLIENIKFAENPSINFQAFCKSYEKTFECGISRS